MIDIGITIATLKAIAGVAKDAGKIDLYNDVINLQQSLLEVVGDNTKMVDDNARLTRELVALRDRVAILEREKEQRAQMTFENNVYWLHRDAVAEGPYCPKCLDGGGRSSHMADRSDDHWWRCTVCDLAIEKPGPAPGRSSIRVAW